MQEKKYYAKVKSPWLRPIVGCRLGALAVHWIFQGMLNMDPTERWFKLALEFLVLLPVAWIVNSWVPWWLAIVLGFLVAHTLNFVLNGQIYSVLKTFGGVRHTPLEFEREVERLRTCVADEPDILFAGAYGSLARKEWSPTSDLDVRLVRAPGFRSAIRVCWLAMRERTRAFWRRFPLDIFVLDGYTSLDKMAEVDFPVVLGGRDRSEAHVLSDIDSP
jgi:hypothetical protein